MWWRFLIGGDAGPGRGVLVSAGQAGGRASHATATAPGDVCCSGAVYTGNAGTYYAEIGTVPAGLAGVIVYIYPVFVAVLSLRFATRLHGRRPWFALGLAIVGVVLALGGVDIGTEVPLSGLGLIVASALIYSVWIVLSARLSGERRDRLGQDAPEEEPGGRDAAVTTAVMMLATATVFGALALVGGRSLLPGTVPEAAWPYLLGIGAVASFLAIQALYAGARRVGAAQAALVRHDRAGLHRRAGVPDPGPDTGPHPARRGGPHPRRGDHRPDLTAATRDAAARDPDGSRIEG